MKTGEKKDEYDGGLRMRVRSASHFRLDAWQF
jgi:hypothetical protein